MDQIIQYFNTISSAHRSLILVGGLTFFFLLESSLPLFHFKYNKYKHLLLNVFFTLTTIIVNFVFAFTIVMLSEWAVNNNIGLLQWIQLPTLFQFIFGLMAMDLISAWLAHYVEHQVKWMWKFHIIHHTDKTVDTTTANRHHPGESFIRLFFTLLAVLICGAPMWLVFAYQSISVVLSQFNHSNVKLPLWLDKGLSIIICTPDMHRVHHHYRQPYSDMNYGNIFSFWDRLFGTYVRVDNSKLIYGLDTHMDQEESKDLIGLLKIPFQAYRQPIDYKDKEKL